MYKLDDGSDEGFEDLVDRVALHQYLRQHFDSFTYSSENLDKRTTLTVGSLPLCCLWDRLVVLPWERKRSTSGLCHRKRPA